MPRKTLSFRADAPYRSLLGVGGVGSGVFFALEGNHDLGRNESRPARLLDVRDYCKLHIIAHYPASLLVGDGSGTSFQVLPIAKVGADETGQRLRGEMSAAGMDCRFVETVVGRPTLQSVCYQYPDGSGGNITTSDSAASALAAEDIDRALEFIDRQTIVLAAPEVPLGVRAHLLRMAAARGAFCVAAFTSAEVPEAIASDLFAPADLVALNQDEAGALTGLSFEPADPARLLEACAATLANRHPQIRIVVTAGAQGAFGFEGGRFEHCPAMTVRVASTAGAGDALLGGVLTALAAGVPFTLLGPRRRSMADRPLASALDFGTLLAAYKVTSPHTIHPAVRLDALLAFAKQQGVAFGEPLGDLFE